MNGFVLAGGASRRFGTDKARWPLNGRPMALHVADALAHVCDVVRLVRRAPEAAWDGLAVVSGDEGPDHHALWGVAVALEAATTPRVVLAPCDLPALREGHLRALVAGAGQGEAVAMGSRIQPLLAVVRAERAQAARHAAANGRSVRSFVADLPRVALPNEALRNVNRREDL